MSHRSEGAADARGPEIVELPWPEGDAPADADCVAEPPAQGVLDHAAATFSRIEVRRGSHVIEERATYRDGAGAGAEAVTVTTGGCAHTGTRYRFVIVDATPAGDTRHHLERALALLQALPLREHTERDFRASIVATISQRADDSCSYTESETATVHCAVAAGRAGRVEVELAFDIAL